MGGDPVQEPAIMADHQTAAAEILEGLLKRPERVDVQVVGRLVEKKDIGAFLEHPRQMHPVSLPSRKHADLLLLVRAREVETGHIGA